VIGLKSNNGGHELVDLGIIPGSFLVILRA
jgi:hypothetical protein